MARDIEKKKASDRAWRARNRDRILAYQAQHRQEINEKARLYRQEHRRKLARQARERYHAHPEKLKARTTQYRWNLRLEVLTHYSLNVPECAHCGEKDVVVLCIDHINGGGNQHRKALGARTSSSIYRWLRKQGYPEGFQVLCWNCNARKTWGNSYKGVKL